MPEFKFLYTMKWFFLVLIFFFQSTGLSFRKICFYAYMMLSCNINQGVYFLFCTFFVWFWLDKIYCKKCFYFLLAALLEDKVWAFQVYIYLQKQLICEEILKPFKCNFFSGDQYFPWKYIDQFSIGEKKKKKK